MSDGMRAPRILIPPDLFRIHLTETGLLPRFLMLLARAREARRTLEGCCDAALEIEDLICASPPPERLRESLRRILDPLGSDVVLRIPSEDPGAGKAEFFPAGSAAEALDSLLRAWSRSWTPGAIRAGGFPEMPGAVEAVPASSVSGRDRSGSNRRGAPEGSSSDPEDPGRILDRAQTLLHPEVPQDPATLEEVRESLVLVRYAAGRAYNRAVRTEDPFEFLARIDSPVPEDPVPAALLGLVRRSFQIEERLVRMEGRSTGGSRPEDVPPVGTGTNGSATGGSLGTERLGVEAVRGRQLIGTPSSPGRASGTAVRRRSGSSESGRFGEVPGKGTADAVRRPVILCVRLTRDLLAAFPDAAAAAERDGGRVGLGARLARAAGRPCVSGIRDLDRIPEGVPVWVDGDLGIVSLETVR